MSPAEPGALRLFFGLRLSPATAATLAAVAAGLRASMAAALPVTTASWVAPARLHVTLVYLGWSRPEVVTALRDRALAVLAGATSFELATAGLGAFPDPRRARVLWAGVPDASGQVAALAASLAAMSADLGFAIERRPFHPHVTLGRIGGDADVRGVLRLHSEQASSKSFVDHVVLFDSAGTSGTSEYQEIARWPLGEAARRSRRHTGAVKTSPHDSGSQVEIDGAPHPDEAAPGHGPEESDHGDQQGNRGDRRR